MKKFLSNHSKIFFMIFLVLGFVLVISALVYATEYTNAHIFYQLLNGKVDFSEEYGNDTIKSFTNKNLYIGFETAGTPMTYEMALNIYNFQKALASVNSFILITGIIMMVCAAAMFVVANHSRSVYYKSNLIVGVAAPSISIIFCIIAMVRNFLLMGQFNDNYVLLNRTAVLQNMYKQVAASQRTDMLEDLYECSSATFIIFGILLIMLVVYSAFMIFYSVFKYRVTAERRNEIIERAVQINV
ncbi:MAG: hypothetical protein K2K15_03950 [Anaeroplasmataceae bacterium]|nr:hypothetical protein [Anaeroplasmataceae bacterium]